MKLLLMAALMAALCCGAVYGRTKEDARALLTDPVVESLYARTYASILERSEKDGFFLESVNGAYTGMFPRTVGALASLYEVTGETEKTRRHVDLVLKIARDNNMRRCAHVIIRHPVTIKPGEGVIAGADMAVSRLDAPYMGCQYFRGAGKPVKAVYVYLAAATGSGTYHMTLSPDLEEEPLAVCDLSAEDVKDGWVRFAFDKPCKTEKGRRYVVTLQALGGSGRPIWHGSATEGPDSEIYAVGSDTDGEIWLHRRGIQMAFAADYGGNVKFDTRPRYAILSRGDQVDGNLHVLAAWAMCALADVDKAWENRTYKQVAELVDTVMDLPYLSYRAPRVFPGLVKNHMFEHSRQGRYWDCWDILTQSWALRTLELMQQVAERRGDDKHREFWAKCEQELLANVHENLTFEVDGKKVYAEMRKADSSDGTLLEGMSWANFGTIASQYTGFDKTILSDTLETYARNARRDWHGHTVWAHEWDFGQKMEISAVEGLPAGVVLPAYTGGRVSAQVIGKGVGWDLVWCARTGNYDRICDWLEFIRDENSTRLYAEAFNLINGETVIQDDGNGEQCAWWCWGMAVAREACGLDPVPDVK
ncbi:MAG: hypothetical protein IK083_07605 [Abditibacteriota bacterium]|nr:hypothetical protein [Abditibacteriota bacterium]